MISKRVFILTVLLAYLLPHPIGAQDGSQMQITAGPESLEYNEKQPGQIKVAIYISVPTTSGTQPGRQSAGDAGDPRFSVGASRGTLEFDMSSGSPPPAAPGDISSSPD